MQRKIRKLIHICLLIIIVNIIHICREKLFFWQWNFVITPFVIPFSHGKKVYIHHPQLQVNDKIEILPLWLHCGLSSNTREEPVHLKEKKKKNIFINMVDWALNAKQLKY